jgi:acyl-CoA reductase-like NAD-dependent aldehyde dehydrogenase
VGSESTNGEGLLVESAFQNSNSLAPQLSPTDRIELLLRIADAARAMHPEAAKQWAIEALQGVKEMRSGKRKVQYETQVISELGSVGSDPAFCVNELSR